MNMKTILVATGLSAPDIGGPATYTKFLEHHLPTLGVGVQVVSFSTVRKFPKGIRHLVYLWRLLRAAKTAECIYALDTVSVGVPAMVACMLTKKPLYLRVPGDYAWEQGQQRFGITATLDTFLEMPVSPPLVRALVGIQRAVAQYATRIVVPSEYMRHVVEQWGIPGDKITRIYSALSPVTVHTSTQTLRRQFGYSGFVVTTAARLVPWKGISALCDAVVLLRTQGVKATLEILGDGDSRGDFEAHVRAIGAESCVTFRGSVAKQELWERIKASDAFVLNTSYEGLSHQLLEVMDIGVPIVTTPVGGNVELISDDVEGLLVPFNDATAIAHALKRIHTDVLACTYLVGNAQAKVASFRESVIAHEVAHLFA
jgi:glycosyltransferase involved in cell wall biosynthesis